MLYHLWQPAPFLAAAGIVTAACLVPVLFLREDGGHGRVFEGVGTYVRHSWRVLRRNPDVGRFLLANAAWEGTFAGARTFVDPLRHRRPRRAALDLDPRARRGGGRVRRSQRSSPARSATASGSPE